LTGAAQAALIGVEWLLQNVFRNAYLTLPSAIW
jgi:hypothetical protein